MVVQTLSGEYIEMELVNDISDGVIEYIMSRLPEEARTFDAVMYVLKNAKKEGKVRRCSIKNEGAFLEGFRK